jgi:subtilisin family serine protease
VRLGLALPVLLLASTAAAQPLAPRLVRHLDRPGGAHPLGDATGRIAVTTRLPRGVSAASLGLWEVAPGIGARRFLPAEVEPYAAAHPGLSLSIRPPLRPLLDVSGKWTQANRFRADTGLDGTGVVVGVVDTGIDVRHPDFLDAAGKTRIAWLLGAGPPQGLHPDLEEQFGCNDPAKSSCAVYAAADIDRILAGTGPGDARDVEGHGTHVASIAAGNGGPSAGTPRYVGVAPGATLVIAAPFGGGGFQDADILNAASFVFDRAKALGLPAVLNLSLGSDYGSHDGLSTLEQGLEAMVGDDKPGRAVVVAAGNSGALSTDANGGGPYGIHTEVTVSPSEVARVPISAGAAASGQGYVWITFQPGDDVEVALRGPDGSSWIGFVGKGDDVGYTSGSGATLVKAGIVNNLPAINPAMTAEMNSASVIFTGRWDPGSFEILLRGQGRASLWMTATGDAAAALFFTRAVRGGTINVPATAPALIAVGCTVNRLRWNPLQGGELILEGLGDDTAAVPDSACYFSSSGPTPLGVAKPEISAPGGYVAAAMSADADPRTGGGGLFDLSGCPAGSGYCALVDARHAVAAGTSMSAPHVTGAAALLLQLDRTLTQARLADVLQAGAHRPLGHMPDAEQLGPGELDLLGARDALLDPATAPEDPDPTKSWFTVSSAFARPDPTWPVWGTIELRRLDGTIAGGVDGKELALVVEGGDVYQPVVKAARGMYRFAVAGRAGDASEVRVEVRYAGLSLGSVTLPVGEDVWRAQDSTFGAASGACATRAPAGSPWGAGATLIAAAALALRRRRRMDREIRGST